MTSGAENFRLGRVFVLAMLVALTACGSATPVAEAPGKATGQRIAVLDFNGKRPVPDSTLNEFSFDLPQPQPMRMWPQVGGNAEHSQPHAVLGKGVDEDWSSRIGSGSNGDYRLLAQPVVFDGKVFTMDARGKVSAFDAQSGSRLWRQDTTPDGQDDKAIGGGLGLADNILYATTGFGEVVALKASDGTILWRKSIGKPLRAPPTLADHRIYVVTIDNELHALDSKNGTEVWQHRGITESAALMGASNPAVTGDTVVVTYNSGEIFSLRAQNGRPAWGDALTTVTQVGALPGIADIRGLPVIDRGRVYAISHGGRMVAIDLRTGERVWDADIGGTNTPLVSGEAVFVLSNDNELVAMTRSSGRIIWVRELQRFENPEDRDSDPVFWFGPVLAGGSLWLTNSLGHLMAYEPKNGAERGALDLGRPVFIPPVVANNTLYIVTDNGRLLAVR